MIRVIDIQEELQGKIGKTKLDLAEAPDLNRLTEEIRDKAAAAIDAAVQIKDKGERSAAIKALESEVLDGYLDSYRNEKVTLDSLEAVDARRDGEHQLKGDVKEILHDLRSESVRSRILERGERMDGRGTADIRSIACEVRIVPRPHGVALFTRGETQAMVTTTLGGSLGVSSGSVTTQLSGPTVERTSMKTVSLTLSRAALSKSTEAFLPMESERIVYSPPPVKQIVPPFPTVMSP